LLFGKCQVGDKTKPAAAAHGRRGRTHEGKASRFSRLLLRRGYIVIVDGPAAHKVEGAHWRGRNFFNGRRARTAHKAECTAFLFWRGRSSDSGRPCGNKKGNACEKKVCP
jgi:hypothetical protein